MEFSIQLKLAFFNFLLILAFSNAVQKATKRDPRIKLTTTSKVQVPSDPLKKEVLISGHENDKIETNLKHNITDPSETELEDKIKITGHENDPKDSGKHDIKEPSLDELQNKIKISGHENDPKDSGKHNIKEPSLHGLEKKIKIAGHKDDPKDTGKHNVKEPSLDELENKIKIGGHENDQKDTGKHNISQPSFDILENKIRINRTNFVEDPLTSEEKRARMEPSLDRLEEADLLRRKHPRFQHMTEKVLKVDEVGPSLTQLEREIAIPHHEENTTTSEPLIMRPGYEGFHGIMAHDGNEAYQHGAHKDHGGHGKDNKTKAADLDAYQTWLDTEEKVSKLARFKKLHEEFAKLNANVNKWHKHQHDDAVVFSDAKVESLDVGSLVKLEEKLVHTIQKLEEEEKKRVKERESHKADL